MNKSLRVILALACGLLGTVSFAVGLRSVYATYTATLNSQAAPSGDPTFNLPSGALRLSGVTGYRITLCAASGQTLSGAGSVQIYYCPANNTALCSGTWPRNNGIDESVTITSTSCNGAACRCQTFPDRRSSGVPDGWIYGAPNGVTTSGGTTGTMLIEGVSQT